MSGFEERERRCMRRLMCGNLEPKRRWGYSRIGRKRESVGRGEEASRSVLSPEREVHGFQVKCRVDGTVTGKTNLLSSMLKKR